MHVLYLYIICIGVLNLFTSLSDFLVCLQCVGDDIEDLEYTPKPEFEGYFKVTNVKDEVMSYHAEHSFIHTFLSINFVV